jgi:hypothetical protein
MEMIVASLDTRSEERAAHFRREFCHVPTLNSTSNIQVLAITGNYTIGHLSISGSECRLS